MDSHSFDAMRCTWRTAQHFSIDTFRTLVDERGPGSSAFELGIPRLTLSRWLAAQSNVPHAAGRLLWHLSRYGKSADDIGRENALRTAQALAQALQARVQALEAQLLATARLVPPRAANDAWTEPTDPRTRLYRRR